MNVRLVAVIVLTVAALHADGSSADSGGPGAAALAKQPQAPAGDEQRGKFASAFRPFVDMPTFMDHVISPAATIVWRTNGFINDSTGDHDLSPKTDADWELVVSGAATLAEATNALRIPQRALDADWSGYVERLARAAERAYQAAEKRDLRTLSEISDHLDETCSSCHRHYGFE